jgi:Lrp/AsnC family transcriptional regulator for asnA, asnC and gidA
MYEIDKIDLQIVDLLMEDGRMPAAEIARRLGAISERAVRYRVGRMVEDRLIQISAVVNPKKFGYNVIADILIEVETNQIENVARALAVSDNVSYVACAIGETDVSVQVVARDTEEVYRFATQVIGRIPGVIKTTTSIVPFVLKDIYQWRLPRQGIV